MTKEELYQQHLNAMYSTNAETCSEEEVEEIFARLLQCLPNDGKLYKYRSIEGEAFAYALDGLQNKYLWMAKASSLNDDFDCSVRFDPMSDILINGFVKIQTESFIQPRLKNFVFKKLLLV